MTDYAGTPEAKMKDGKAMAPAVPAEHAMTDTMSTPMS
jgi:hypothetical protein